MAKKRKQTNGFSFTEVLVSLTALGVILAAVYSVFLQTQKTQAAQELEGEMQQNARAAIEFVVRELRNTAFLSCLEGTDTPCPTTGDKIRFQSMNDANPRIFSWSSADNLLRFSNTPVGAEDRQPITDQIIAFTLSPKDANNNPTASLAAVRRLAISLTARSTQVDPNTRAFRSYTLSTGVTLRN